MDNNKNTVNENTGDSQAARVLACIDGSQYSNAVCDYAAWIASRTGAPLKLLHNIERTSVPAVADLSGSIGLGSQEELLEELTALEQQRASLLLQQGKLMLDAARERVEQAGGVDSVEACQRHDSLPESLIELEDKIRVLVIGIRGEQHEASQQGLGSHLETVVRALHKPILVVNQVFREPRNILLAYDGSEAARKALELVASSPLFRGTPCHLVTVGNVEGVEELLAAGSQTLRDAGLQVTTSHLNGKTVEALTAYQDEHEIDLTVMGAFSHSRLRDLLLGSITAKMLLNTAQPLLLLR